jgi:hypothetical protein
VGEKKGWGKIFAKEDNIFIGKVNSPFLSSPHKCLPAVGRGRNKVGVKLGIWLCLASMSL